LLGRFFQEFSNGSDIAGAHRSEFVSPVVPHVIGNIRDIAIRKTIAKGRHLSAAKQDLSNNERLYRQHAIACERRSKTAGTELTVAGKATALHINLLAGAMIVIVLGESAADDGK
jgi:hypothetical protein